jgi:hypothetical protein
VDKDGVHLPERANRCVLLFSLLQVDWCKRVECRSQRQEEGDKMVGVKKIQLRRGDGFTGDELGDGERHSCFDQKIQLRRGDVHR